MYGTKHRKFQRAVLKETALIIAMEYLYLNVFLKFYPKIHVGELFIGSQPFGYVNLINQV